ncbi:carbohydrate ABC transporter permease [Arthrobacter sp. M4]|uniref:carbohydrate ABC transporter permease n=1 Tax=Arthrobacter sp. M4 TaxID=218160 RepID=UPI001CDCABC4|nr:sugar ABC transporter permease [Arthrobacter sp. M4]MCA4131812.1 sugar ABC transporter permease [Arthrobacter sp. M4]
MTLTVPPTQLPPAPAVGRRGRPGRISTARRQEALTGYAFTAPTIVGFLVFVLGPLVAAIYLSLTKYNILTPPKFIGIDNYVRMFRDERLAQTYGNTVLYVGAAVVLINGFGLLFAVLINQRLPKALTYVFRSAYFFPYLVALVYVSIIWQALFQKDTGILNYYLTALGGEKIDWLNSSEFAKVSVIIVDTWRNAGFAMLIFVAALQEVPKDMVEAARMDGANEWQIFCRIVMPMISQATFFNITMTIIGAFQIYESIIVLTRGGPGDASRSVVMYIAEVAFNKFDMGYASAIAVTLFLIIMLVTLAQFRLRKSWVNNE